MQSSQFHPHLDYFRLLINPNQQLNSLSELLDIQNIISILAKIKQFPSLKLQLVPTSFSELFSHLKAIYNKLSEFWVQSLKKQLLYQQIDFVEIARHKNQKQFIKLLNLIIQTLLLSSQKQYFISKILQTSPQTQQYFMSIVSTTLQSQPSQPSPSTTKQHQIYNKILQLDIQNQNLQNLINQLYKQNQQYSAQNTKNEEKIKQKDQQIHKLNEYLLIYTHEISNKNLYKQQLQHHQQLIQKLKIKLMESTQYYQQAIFQYKSQILELNQKIQYYHYVENQLSISKQKIQNFNQSLQEFAELNKKYHQIKIKLSEKQEQICQNTELFNEKSKKINQLQIKLIQKQLQLVTKNRQIDELTKTNSIKIIQNQDDQISLTSSISIHRPLLQHCPQMLNNQIENLHQNNKKLQNQIEIKNNIIKQLQTNIDNFKHIMQKSIFYQNQNQKLLAYIQIIKNQHIQEKMLILGVLYQLRPKQSSAKQKPTKPLLTQKIYQI